MTEFDPVTLFFIIYESIGVWLWLLLGLALALLAGIVASAVRLRRAGGSAGRPILAAFVIGLLATAAATFFVPAWTLADLGALSAPVDYAFAVLLALVPGAIVGALVFIVAASRCAHRGATASSATQAPARA